MKIIFNAKEIEIEDKDIPYSTLCSMAGLESFFTPTITYYIPSTQSSGSIIDGTYLQPEEGMIINAVMTNNA